jgi:lipoate-protein ligase A
MALDQALLDEAERTGEGFLRCYRWDPFCLSFGRNEPAARRYDRAAIEARGIATVRRPTGGRAVWHADECTYAVAAPISAFASLAQAYREIHATIALALETLGVRATLAPASRPVGVGAGACFAAPAGGEVLVAGRKVAGSAQLGQGSAFLQHGSILLGGDQRLVAEVTLGAAPPGGDLALGTALGREVTFDEAAEALAARAQSWPGTWGAAPPALVAELAGRHAARFQDPDWTWRR